MTFLCACAHTLTFSRKKGTIIGIRTGAGGAGGGTAVSQLTKRAIIDCTLDLAEKKSLRKITVRDIVTACGITRNTFYYYFHDIYDVIDQALEEQTAGLVGAEGAEWESAIFSLIEFAARRKRVWRNLYRSVGHEETARFIMSRLHSVIVQNITKLNGGKPLSARDEYIITSFYEEALFGIMARWLEDGHTDGNSTEMVKYIRRIECIFAGNLHLAVQNAERTPEGK